MSQSDDRAIMGTAEAAHAALVERAQAWRKFRQPVMGAHAQLRAHEITEREAQFQLANAALLWLWHEENP